jgi:hypothetical protein
VKETEQEVGSMSQASKATIQHKAHFGFTSWTSIFETLFDISMAVLFWIKFWRIGWQEFHFNLRMVGKIGADFFTGMNTSSIPDQNDLAWNVPLQVLESFNDLLAFDRSVKVPFVNPARQGQRHSSG